MKLRYTLLATCFTVVGGTSADAQLPPSQFSLGASFACGSVVLSDSEQSANPGVVRVADSGFDPLTGATFSFEAKAETTVSVAAGSTGAPLPVPGAAINGSGSTNVACFLGNASASILYRVGLSTPPNAPFVTVPLLLSTTGSAEATGNAVTTASITLHKETVSAGTIFLHNFLVRASGLTGPPLDSFVESLVVGLEPGTVLRVTMTANAQTIQLGGDFEGSVDPAIEIDPDFMVEVDGELVPASEVYLLEYSSGVPEPGATALGMAALTTLAWQGLRARRRSAPGAPAS